MSLRVISDPEYKNWIAELSKRYRSAQIKAAVAVNKEMLKFYWELGKEIVARQWENQYGKGFFEKLSKDLKEAIPEAKGLSPRNLRYIEHFYKLYSSILQQPVAKSDEPNLPQPVANFGMIENLVFRVPWKHHRLLIDKFSEEPGNVLFYLNEIIKNNWSYVILDHMIDSGLHLRQGKAITNFNYTLPSATGELAQELTKDPYIFDFTNLTIPYQERELKEELLKNSKEKNSWNLELATCSEAIDLSSYGIKHNSCVDGTQITKISFKDDVLMNHLGIKIEKMSANLFGDDIIPDNTIRINETTYATLPSKNKDKGQRNLCGCIPSKDIGRYDTCPHQCVYCYANTTQQLTNYKNHNPKSEII